MEEVKKYKLNKHYEECDYEVGDTITLVTYLFLSISLTEKQKNCWKLVPNKPIKKNIDKVTTNNLSMSLKLCDITVSDTLLDIIIDIVEILEEKGNDTSIKDIIEIKNNHKI